MDQLIKIADTNKRLFRILNIGQNALHKQVMNMFMYNADSTAYYDLNINRGIYAKEIEMGKFTVITNACAAILQNISTKLYHESDKFNTIKDLDLYIHLKSTGKKFKVECPSEEAINYETEAVYIPYRKDNIITYKNFTKDYNDINFASILGLVNFINPNCSKVFLPIPEGYPYCVKREDSDRFFWDSKIQGENTDIDSLIDWGKAHYEGEYINYCPTFDSDDIELWVEIKE